MTISTTAHTDNQVAFAKGRTPLSSGTLGPLSEWVVTLCFGLRRQTAANNTCKAGSVICSGETCADQVSLLFNKSPDFNRIG